MYLAWNAFVSIVGAVSTTLVSVVILFYQGTRPLYNRFLALALFCFGYVLIAFFLVETGLVRQLPHLYRTGSIAGFIFWPAIYFYVRLVIQPASLRAYDLLHALPVGLYLIDFAPFFALSADQKLRLEAHKTPAQLVANLDEGWLMPLNGYPVLRLGLILMYCSLQVYLVYRWYQSSPVKDTAWVRTWLRWFILLGIAQGALVITSVPLVTRVHHNAYHALLTTTIGLVGVLITVMLLIRPIILYGLEQLLIPVIPKRPAATGSRATPKSAQPASLTEDDVFHGQLTAFIQEKEPYLRMGYTLSDLAVDTGIPVHQLSNYINSRYQVNFNEYINQYRIDYFKQRVRRGDWSHKTLEALAIESGFSNRFTFTNAFKRSTGITPSDYLRQLRQAS